MRERVYRRVNASVEQRETRNEKRTLALRLQVAGFAAGLAVVLAVVTEADVVPPLAENAEAFAVAVFFFPLAFRADIGHVPRVACFAVTSQVTMVTGWYTNWRSLIRPHALQPPRHA